MKMACQVRLPLLTGSVLPQHFGNFMEVVIFRREPERQRTIYGTHVGIGTCAQKRSYHKEVFCPRAVEQRSSAIAVKIVDAQAALYKPLDLVDLPLTHCGV